MAGDSPHITLQGIPTMECIAFVFLLVSMSSDSVQSQVLVSGKNGQRPSTANLNFRRQELITYVIYFFIMRVRVVVGGSVLCCLVRLL